jgi:hypothetical protein
MAALRPIPEHLLGEPLPVRLGPVRTLASLSRRLLLLALALLVGAPAWPVYGFARLFVARPPTFPSFGRCVTHVRQVLGAKPPAPGLPFAARLGLLQELLTRLALRPVLGLSWVLDELMYGQELDAVRVEAPLVVLSAARSGSTQLARALEDDPRHIAPSMLQLRYPWLWLWRLARGPLSGLVGKDWVRRSVEAEVPEEFLRRHEVDPFRTDTLEVLFGLGHHIDLLRCLGPGPFAQGFSHASRTPDNEAFWDDLVVYVDRVGRKALLFGGPVGHRLMVKGHFLAAADRLAEVYPDARFLTVLRRPDERFRSLFNFHRVNPSEELLGPLPWSWVVESSLAGELAYCEQEQLWFSRPGPSRRSSLPFELYKRDLGGALQRVYAELLDQPEGPPQRTAYLGRGAGTGYQVDRTLEELGVDSAALNERLADYGRWIDSLRDSVAAQTRPPA